MVISIKSECDSRPLIYPLIKCLYSYGTICVITPNMYCKRLIDGDEEGIFRNIQIYVDDSDSLTDIVLKHGINLNNYDFVIVDNIGVLETDLQFIIVTNAVSDVYLEDVKFMFEEEGVKLFKFGAPIKRGKEQKPEKQTDNPDMFDPASKWHTEKSQEELFQEALLSKDTPWFKWPTWDSMETMESQFLMPTPDRPFIQYVHKIMKPYLNVDERFFIKEVETKDVVSGRLPIESV